MFNEKKVYKSPLAQAEAINPNNKGNITINEIRRYKPIIPYWREFSKGDYSGEAKVYDLPSKYGINNGRVSKLTLSYKGEPILNYDRGWDTKSGKNELAPEHQEFYNELLAALEATNQREE